MKRKQPRVLLEEKHGASKKETGDGEIMKVLWGKVNFKIYNHTCIEMVSPDVF